jgi:pantetheine-phosphate adenylyltransferase
MLMANRHLDRDLETVFLMSDKEMAHVSSTLIKQIAPHASDAMMAEFVPQCVIEPLRRRLESRAST